MCALMQLEGILSICFELWLDKECDIDSY
jgi:hypothetical protein